MNKIILMGRLTKEPEIYATKSGGTIVSYTLAVDRPNRNRNTDEPTADFIRCCCLFQNVADFAQQYLHKGMKIIVTGRIQTGSYMNKNGQKVYTTDIVVENQEFAESKSTFTPAPEKIPGQYTFANEYMDISDDIVEELPFY